VALTGSQRLFLLSRLHRLRPVASRRCWQRANEEGEQNSSLALAYARRGFTAESNVQSFQGSSKHCLCSCTKGAVGTTFFKKRSVCRRTKSCTRARLRALAQAPTVFVMTDRDFSTILPARSASSALAKGSGCRAPHATAALRSDVRIMRQTLRHSKPLDWNPAKDRYLCSDYT
jgi:hypothetical protein